MEFTGTHGPKKAALDAFTELSAFNLFIDYEMIERSGVYFRLLSIWSVLVSRNLPAMLQLVDQKKGVSWA